MRPSPTRSRQPVGFECLGPPRASMRSQRDAIRAASVNGSFRSPAPSLRQRDQRLRTLIRIRRPDAARSFGTRQDDIGAALGLGSDVRPRRHNRRLGRRADEGSCFVAAGCSNQGSTPNLTGRCAGVGPRRGVPSSHQAVPLGALVSASGGSCPRTCRARHWYCSSGG